MLKKLTPLVLLLAGCATVQKAGDKTKAYGEAVMAGSSVYWETIPIGVAVGLPMAIVGDTALCLATAASRMHGTEALQKE